MPTDRRKKTAWGGCPPLFRETNPGYRNKGSGRILRQRQWECQGAIGLLLTVFRRNQPMGEGATALASGGFVNTRFAGILILGSEALKPSGRIRAGFQPLSRGTVRVLLAKKSAHRQKDINELALAFTGSMKGMAIRAARSVRR